MTIDAKVSKPLVAIIVNNHNGDIYNCIKSIEKTNKLHTIEIIIIGALNGSIQTHDLSINKTNISQITEEGASIPSLMNYAAKNTRADFLLFLTTPLEFREKWIESLLVGLSSTGASGVTPKIVYNNIIVEAGCSVFENCEWSSHGANSEPNDPRYNYVRELDSGSIFALFLPKSLWSEMHGFDNRIENPQLALLDLQMKLITSNYKLVYNPFFTLYLCPRQITFSPDTVKRFRPTIDTFHSQKNDSLIRKNILILGICLVDKSHNTKDIFRILSETKYHHVRQEWISLGKGQDDSELNDIIAHKKETLKPKFEILNEIIQTHNINEYDYVIVSDDDIILPYGFLDEYIYLQEKYSFRLAQPARTNNSYVDHPIVERQRGIVARQTMYVEIGPLFSVHREAYNIIFPFDLSSPMGWGYGNVWAYEFHKRGLKMGIIDHTPVDHSIRKPVQNYSWIKADEQRNHYLKNNKHYKLEECFRVLEVYI